MSERETWIDLIRNEYDPRPNLGKADYPGFEWNDGAGRIADAILADRAMLLRKHADAIERMQEALRAFAVHATYPVSTEINPRGYAWRGEEALDYAKGMADAAIVAPPPS